MANNFKKLIRNLRTKAYEKISPKKTNDNIIKGEKSKKNKL